MERQLGTADHYGRAAERYKHRLVVPDMPPPIAYESLLEEIFTNEWYSNFGPLTRRFEAELLEKFGGSGETCISCSSATAGLTAALVASGVAGPVLLPAYTFPASLSAIRAAGLRPVVMDVDPDTWVCAPETLHHALLETGADAVMLVSPFGIHQDWQCALEVCRRYNAAVFVDSASGLGVARSLNCARDNVFEVFSLHATKPFAIGEGGVIFCARVREDAVRAALNFGLSRSGESEPRSWGINGKMSEFHAAVGLVQIQRIDDIVSNRIRFVEKYRLTLAQHPSVAHPERLHSAPWQFYPVLMPRRDAAESLIEYAGARGVEVRRYYRPSLSRWHGTDCFAACPVSEELSERVCALPVRSISAENEGSEIIDVVSSAVRAALNELGMQRDCNSTNACTSVAGPI